ncbi:MAG: archaeosortase/exosortase family protein [bacterium]
MSRIQKIVLASAVTLILVWLGLNFGRLVLDADGKASTEREVCLVLGSLFFLAILFRPSPAAATAQPPDWIVPATGTVGLILALSGLVFDSQQLHWLGLLLLFYACLQWALPRRFSVSIPPALLLLYWISPAPFSIVGPFQLTMQHASIQGAEWLAHCFNVPAWADANVLRTETMAIDVPQACSGMTTAIAVFVSCLGTGLLFRIRWLALTGLILLGLFQILALNILRIALIAMMAPRMPPEWAFSYIHDSLAVLLIAGIVLIQVEVAMWLKWRTGRLKERDTGPAEKETEDKASILHPFWRYMSRYAWLILAAVVLSVGIAAALYKRRPYHRSQMIHRLVNNLAIQNLADAERTAVAAVAADKGNLPARYSMAQVLVYRKKFDQALEVLRNIPEKKRSVGSTIIRAQALAGKKKFTEAISLINTLTDQEKQIPPIAMIQAEMAAEQNDARRVASNVVLAASAQSPALLKRVRTLFPFLAGKEEWKTIIACDQPLPFADPVHAAIAVDAYFKLNDIPGMARTLRRAITKWPEDPIFLTHLLAIAVLRPEGEWSNLFARSLLRNINEMDGDRLAACLQYGFQLQRPELAWLLYRRLSQIDPGNPALYFTASQFADVWFTFKMSQLNLGATTPKNIIDLKPLYNQTRTVWPFNLLWDNIPLATELTDGIASEVAAKYLGLCIEELKRREKETGLNLRSELLFVTALTRAGNHSEAGKRLDKLDKRYPERELELLYNRLTLSNIQHNWASSYEISRRCTSLTLYPNISTSLSQINALIQLGLGTHALVIAERLHSLFPDSPQAAMGLAVTLESCGFNEESLFVMERTPEAAGTAAWAIALYVTERFFESDRFAAALEKNGLKRSDRLQRLLLPMAELSIIPPCPEIEPTSDEMDKKAAELTLNPGPPADTYLGKLKQLILNWYKCRGAAGSSDPAKWEAIANDKTESALALHDLATLLVWKKQAGEAEKILARATALLPDSSVLWQSRVAASGGKREVIQQARLSCPTSSELWLAELVAKTTNNGSGDWAVAAVRTATEQQQYSIGSIVRAGDFLLRAGMTNAAIIAARYSITKANGLLPAYVLGLRCALTIGDRDWAISCASEGARNALDPTPFEITLVDLQMRKGKATSDLSGILKRLREKFPSDPQWPERLCSFYFQNGNMRAVSSVFESIIENKLTARTNVPNLLVAAEAARLEGHIKETIDILTRALERAPDNIDVQNNLIYILAQDPKTIGRAQALLPKLLARAQPSSAVLDTAAVVYLKANDLGKALEFSKKALNLVRPEDYAADELHLNAAEIYFLMGDYTSARSELKLSHQDSRQPLIIENRRLSLMSALENKNPTKTFSRQNLKKQEL